ncbi:hypothetical protein WL21_04505 [Burkholderia ubonensis]|uniref:FliM/FliN family flagellar motor switch protein n=1 Tax=Burkholderia ubonensis TaxID=101571 RepID=UPI00075C475C|nr:FliM/FliN family flagellar motor switch protein [Burkholderia ubonensis]KVO87652.1 hypothetical protein WJ81_15475 [Burkholderia ubonensis]KVZ57269.1 hypothetical protein WL20_23260 [Burkholderia ubonensis]KVZ72967.1 hypothetical protein WL21_04505 [Burkholderia ubonensis]
MNPDENPSLDTMLDDFVDLSDTGAITPEGAGASVPAAALRTLRRIPVRLTLEVGSASVPLSELLGYGAGSVVELDRVAGEPLVVKVNGLPIGTAEVVVCGEHYGLKLIELGELGDLGALAS